MDTNFIAFNGISFQAPADWEIGAMGPEYLRLDTEQGPVMEVKWQRGLKDPLGKRALAKLAKRVKAVSGVKLEQASLPREWKKALKGFEATAFSWASPQVRGRGAALYCDTCRTFTLVQFYSGADQVDDAQVLEVLSSLKDHPGKQGGLWAVYDIRAQIPRGFDLAGFTFQPGKFELNFKRKHMLLTLHRFAPAGIMLKEHDLEALGRARYAEVLDHLKLQTRVSDEGRRVDFVERKKPFFLFAFWSRLLRKPSRAVIRLTHLPEEDRILAVKLAGRGHLDDNLFTRVCTDYGIVPEKKEDS